MATGDDGPLDVSSRVNQDVRRLGGMLAERPRLVAKLELSRARALMVELVRVAHHTRGDRWAGSPYKYGRLRVPAEIGNHAQKVYRALGNDKMDLEYCDNAIEWFGDSLSQEAARQLVREAVAVLVR